VSCSLFFGALLVGLRRRRDDW